jgi:hypothetical protein
MLRKSYINKFQGRRPFSMDYEIKNREDDDNFILSTGRPLKESEIMNIPRDRLEFFVESVLTDKKLNNLIFSSNADSEIKIIKKSAEALNKYKRKIKHGKDVNPQDIVLKRAKNEAITNIVKETNNYKDQQKNKLDILSQKNYSFYKIVKDKRTKEERDQKEYVFEYRRKRFMEIFGKIKKKIIRGSIFLPEVGLNIKNVYSRLFHNAVYLGGTKKSSLKEEEFKDNLSESEKTLKKDMSKLNVKNVISDSSGKEFTLKITENEYMKCFSKHSGGPQVKLKELEDSLKKEEGVIDLIGMKDDNGNSFLHSSVKEQILDLVYYFLMKGLDPNYQNNDGETPFHLAMSTGDKEVYKH